jgi:predicted GNAT family acetyltransferase
MIRNPSDYASMVGGRTQENMAAAQALQNEAFADPQNPLRITNPQALSQLTQMITSGPLGFAPAGITKQISSPSSLLENSIQPQTGISQISQQLESSGLKADLYESGNTITLSRIIVPKENRNQGIGSDAMQQIIDYADSMGKRVVLSPSSDFGGNKERLKSFYKKFGFVENKGKNKDFSVSETMYREPSE